MTMPQRKHGTRPWGVLVSTMLAAAGVSAEAGAHELSQRRIEFTYRARIADVPQDAEVVDLWIPVPTDGLGQRVVRVEVNHPDGGNIAVDPAYGNKVFHKRYRGPFTDENTFEAELVFEIVRDEVEIGAAKKLAKTDFVPASDEQSVYLAENRLIPLDGPVEEIVGELKLESNDPLRTARRVYDYLIDTMEYNWLADGAGRGDVRWACDSKTGDCTDYHSTFMAVCRNRGIPADHQFGFPIPKDKKSGPITHYHCWAQFWTGATGWVPVDISEADKHPALKEYNFGSYHADIIRMSHGRDVTLVPPQAGESLNIFVFPYVEVDGVEFGDAEKKKDTPVTWSASFVDKS